MTAQASDPRELRERDMIAAGLTLREVRALQGLARGRTTVQMCMDLDVSKSAIVRDVREVKRKLHAATDAESVAIAFRRGWLI